MGQSWVVTLLLSSHCLVCSCYIINPESAPFKRKLGMGEFQGVFWLKKVHSELKKKVACGAVNPHSVSSDVCLLELFISLVQQNLSL